MYLWGTQMQENEVDSGGVEKKTGSSDYMYATIFLIVLVRKVGPRLRDPAVWLPTDARTKKIFCP